jgi:hypothetical protein
MQIIEEKEILNAFVFMLLEMTNKVLWANFVLPFPLLMLCVIEVLSVVSVKA